MIILSTTSEVLRIKLAGAVTTNELYCNASFRDNTDPDILPDSNMVRSNGTTAATLVGAPAPGQKRLVEDMHIFNKDTASAAVTIEKYNGSTAYPIFEATLGVGEKIEFQSASGFKVLTNSGAVKTSLNQGTSPVTSDLSLSVLASNVDNNNAVANTMQDVTGLSFPVVSGNKYYFRFVMTVTVAATTTGGRFSINGPSFTQLAYRSDVPLAATTRTLGNYVAYDLPAASSATLAQTGNLVTIEGTITPSANGNVIARFASELSATTVTVEGGLSYVQWMQTA